MWKYLIATLAASFTTATFEFLINKFLIRIAPFSKLHFIIGISLSAITFVVYFIAIEKATQEEHATKKGNHKK